MFLIYINKLGPDYKGEHIFEFIFNNNIINIGGDDWDLSPASGRPKPPGLKDIKVVGTVNDSKLNLDLVQDSDYFSVLDALDGVIALGWESYDVEDFDADVDKRLVFRFGETIEEVNKKLLERKFKLKQVKI